MIAKYNTFLGDRLFESAVNESMIYYTKDFKDALEKLAKKSSIAKDLIEVEYTEVKPDMTFIGMSDKEGYFSFMQIKKAISAIKKTADDLSLNKTTVSNICKRIEDGTTSQSDVNFIYSKDPWNLKDNKARGEGKIAKLVNQIFPDKYAKKEVEEFTNQFKKVGESNAKFSLEYGEDIKHWYLESNYEEQTGHLGTSCMRYERCSSYLNIYSENPEVCGLLILKDEDTQMIKGRALVWKLDKIEIENVEFYMDRVYAIDDATKLMFDEYADTQGWLKRLTSSYGDCQDFKLGKIAYEGIKASVKLEEFDFELYPYMDTFKRLDHKKGLLINDENSEKEGCYIMTQTDGTYEDTSGKYSEYFDCRIPESEAIWSEPLRDWIYSDGAIEVEEGSSRYRGWYPDEYEGLMQDCVTKDWIHENDATYSDFYNDSFLGSDAIDVITYIGDDSTLDSIETSHDSLSEKDDNIYYDEMECAKYLEKHGVYEYIANGILNFSYKTKKYYITDLERKVYKTDSGIFVMEDCIALGLNPDENNHHYTDLIAYNFNMDIETKKKIKSALKEKQNELKSIVSGQQTELKFDKAEAKEYLKKKKRLLEDIEVRLYEIDQWIE